VEYWTFGFARCGFRTLLFDDDDDIARVFILLLLEAKSSFSPMRRFRRRDDEKSSSSSREEESEELTKDWSSETNALPLCCALFDKEDEEVQILIDEDIRE
jgi:hypothetical protein|tara:strand:- start:126 stop:428 length:303 start_codon:yes stop_codon:yes gene_type:complete